MWEAQAPTFFLLFFSCFYANLSLMRPKNKKVICAMSGGVDSLVAAALLKKQGYDVVGVFMLMYQGSKSQNAEKIAAKLDIPFHVLDVRKEFKKRVIDYFIKEYKRGRTPNPCVECNRWIKFRFLLEKALALKADYIATGHYARIKFVNSKQIRYSLITAKDKSKDQSYFLWTLTQSRLKRILFPIGDHTKGEVRMMAKKWDLPVFKKRESQEICFVATTVKEFLKKALPAEVPLSGTKAGPIITVNNKKVGEHEGLAFYTIGQRKGIKIGGIGPASTRQPSLGGPASTRQPSLGGPASTRQPSLGGPASTRQPSLGGPFYVVDKDFKNNSLIVAKSEHAPELYKREMKVKNVNWISNKPKFPLKCQVKIRYLTPSASCTIYGASGRLLHNRRTRQNIKYKVQFSTPQRAITPGQSAVFYLRNEILGGGIII